MSKFVLFVGVERRAEGTLSEMGAAARGVLADSTTSRVAIFDSATGRPVDFDTESEAPPDPAPPRKPGRPKLGVVSREVSLLPRHWEWLGAQRGGASATLRRLVDARRKETQTEQAKERAIEAAHRFIWDLAGDQPGFEEATRALFRKDFGAFEGHMSKWPRDIRDQALRFLGPRSNER